MIGSQGAWLLIALMLGGFVGWFAFFAARTRRKAGLIWFVAGLIAVGVVTALATVDPDWINAAVLMIIAYVVGCAIGWGLHHLTFAGTSYEEADSRLPKPGYTFPRGRLGTVIASTGPAAALQPFGITTDGTSPTEPVTLVAAQADGPAPGAVHPANIAVPLAATQVATASSPTVSDTTPANGTSAGSAPTYAPATPAPAGASAPLDAPPAAVSEAAVSENAASADSRPSGVAPMGHDGAPTADASPHPADIPTSPSVTASAAPSTSTSVAPDAATPDGGLAAAGTTASSPTAAPGSLEATPVASEPTTSEPPGMPGAAITPSAAPVAAGDAPSAQSLSPVEAPGPESAAAEVRDAPTHPTGIAVPVVAAADAASAPTAAAPHAAAPTKPVSVEDAQASKDTAPAPAPSQNAATSAEPVPGGAPGASSSSVAAPEPGSAAEETRGAPIHPTGITVPVVTAAEATSASMAAPEVPAPIYPEGVVPSVSIEAAQASNGTAPAQASLQNAAPTAREEGTTIGAAESAPSAGMPKPSTLTSTRSGASPADANPPEPPPPVEGTPTAGAAPTMSPESRSASPPSAPAPTPIAPVAAASLSEASPGSGAAAPQTTSPQTISSTPAAAPAPATTGPEPEKMPALPDEDRHAGQRPVGLMTARDNKADDLKRIKGIGPQNEGRLHGLGVWHFDQIAAWTPDNVKWVGSYLAFHGRIDREKWIEQAKALAAGLDTEFSKRVAAGKVATSRDDGSFGQTNVAPLPKPDNR